jgi:hypothetical protein
VVRIPAAEVTVRKRIGRAGKRPVYQVSGAGGIHLVVDDDAKILGAGSHPAVARHLARKNSPDVVYDQLEKSEPIDLASIPDAVAQGLVWTDQLRAAQRGR